ncbi:MAG: peptide transporter [Planctomycetota bacterium]|nr:MAG: peptide transporter [Planctomycetota bacterium]
MQKVDAPPKPYRELTPASVLGGVVMGLILNMGICYAGLQIGFTIVGSAVAAVLGFGFLRGVLRKGSILEVNIFQTVASSVNTVNAGIIFTVPVLFLLGMQEDIDYPALVLAATAGSMLGVVMIIPLRKQIIEFERLRFPEGVAVAAILKSPGAGVEKSRLLIGGVILSAIVSALTKKWDPKGTSFWPESVNLGETLHLPPGFTALVAISLLSLGAGYLAGRHGLAVLYGTILNYWILVPIAIGLGWVPMAYADFSFFETGEEAYKRAEDFLHDFAHFTSRHVGIGMILGGAIAGILVALPALKAAFASLRTPAGAGGRREEVDIKVLNGGLAFGLLLMFFATKISGGENVSYLTALIVTLAGGAWLWLAGLVVAQTTGRTDWSPLSGLALIAIAIMMAIMGTSKEYIVPAVTVGAAICVATSMCADMMADLKTGYLVGSLPVKQQIAQILTCWVGPPVSVLTVILLWQAYGFGPDQAEILYQRAQEQGPAAVEAFEAAGGTAKQLPDGTPQLKAPQAGALKAAIEIVQDGKVPLGKYLTGAILSLVLSVLVSPGLGVMVGLSMYLPFEYMIVFGMGGILNILLTRWRGARWAEDKGVPVAAGLIVGDALVGVINAVVMVVVAV